MVCCVKVNSPIQQYYMSYGSEADINPNNHFPNVGKIRGSNRTRWKNVNWIFSIIQFEFHNFGRISENIWSIETMNEIDRFGYGGVVH